MKINLSRRDVLIGALATGLSCKSKGAAMAAEFEKVALRGHKDRVTSASIGSEFAVTSAQDGFVKVWNLTSGIEEKRFEASPACSCVGRDGLFAFTSKDKIYCQTRTGAARVVEFHKRLQAPTADLQRGTRGLAFEATGSDPDSLLLSSDSARVYLITSSALLEFDLLKSTLLRQFTFDGSRGSSRFSPQGQVLAFSTRSEEVEVWDLKKLARRHTLWGHKQGIASIAIARGGKFLITGSRLRDFSVWDLDGGKEFLSASGKTGSDDYPITACALSPDGDFAAVGDYYTVALWNVKEKSQIAILGRFEREVTCMQFSDDGNLLIAGSGNGEVAAWRLGLGTAAAPTAPLEAPEGSGTQTPEIKF